jgi:Protein of unknown function (DUF3108)
MQAKTSYALWASVAVLLLCQSPARGGTLDISYAVSLGGAQIMEAGFSATVSKSAYTGEFTAKTTGVSKLFSKTRYRLTTRGKVKTSQLLPIASDYERQKNGKTRNRSLAFEDSTILTEGQDFPPSVLPYLGSPVLDPISATFAMALIADPCNFRTRVFDGRDVYDIRTRPLGGTADKPVCNLIYKPVAGDDVDNGDRDTMTYDITFARAAGDFSFVPVSLSGSSKGVPFDVTATALSIDGAAFSY